MLFLRRLSLYAEYAIINELSKKNHVIYIPLLHSLDLQSTSAMNFARIALLNRWSCVYFVHIERLLTLLEKSNILSTFMIIYLFPRQ